MRMILNLYKPATENTHASKELIDVSETKIDPSTIELNPKIGNRNVKTRHSTLSKVLETNTEIILGISKIETTDMVVLQRLTALTQNTQNVDVGVRRKSPSEQYICAATLLGLDQHLNFEQSSDVLLPGRGAYHAENNT